MLEEVCAMLLGCKAGEGGGGEEEAQKRKDLITKITWHAVTLLRHNIPWSDPNVF